MPGWPRPRGLLPLLLPSRSQPQPGPEGFPCSLHRPLERIRPPRSRIKSGPCRGTHGSAPVRPGLTSSHACRRRESLRSRAASPSRQPRAELGALGEPLPLPPAAEIHRHSRPLPGSTGPGTGNLPPLPPAPEPPPAPGSPRSSTGHHHCHSSTAKPNTSVAQWDSWEARGASTHPCLAALAVLGQPRRAGAAHRLPATVPYVCLESCSRDKSSHSSREGSQKQSTVCLSFVSVTPRAALELLWDVALEMRPRLGALEESLPACEGTALGQVGHTWGTERLVQSTCSSSSRWRLWPCPAAQQGALSPPFPP